MLKLKDLNKNGRLETKERGTRVDIPHPPLSFCSLTLTLSLFGLGRGAPLPPTLTHYSNFFFSFILSESYSNLVSFVKTYYQSPTVL